MLFTLAIVAVHIRGAHTFVTPINSRNSRALLFAKDTESKLDVEPAVDVFDAHFGEYVSQEDVKNILSVCSEVQNSQEYQPPDWADACKLIDGQEKGCSAVVATKDVKKGDILTLFPIHAIGLRNVKEGDIEYIEFNTEEDEELFRGGICDVMKVNIRLVISLDRNSIPDPVSTALGTTRFIRMFILSMSGKEIRPGWLGGVIKTASTASESNCITLPLLNASPFCAIVATQDVKEGEELVKVPVQSSNWDLEEQLEEMVAVNYAKGIGALRTKIQKPLIGPFHQVNLDYPGLRRIRSDPDIFEIDDFLSDDEIERIITKITPYMEYRMEYDDETEKFVKVEDANYERALIPKREIPSIIDKITSMTNCTNAEVGLVIAIHYEQGKNQQTVLHVDDTRISLSGMFKTTPYPREPQKYHCYGIVFCYLNDVAEEDGGSTYFPNLDLRVVPKKGRALIHFPTDVKGRVDSRTMHQGSPSVGEKWILAIQLYNTGDISNAYMESKIDPMSNDII